MRENEFEKKVREKMEQLGFDPSESVWTGVDREIKKERKRRVPLFWLFLIPGLLVAGGAYYFVANKNTPVRLEKFTAPEDITKKQKKESAIQSLEPQKNIQETSNDKAANNTRVTIHNSMHYSSQGLTNQNPVDQTGTRRIAKKETGVTNGEVKEKNQPLENSAAAGTGVIVINDYSNKTVKSEKDSVISSATVKNKEQKTKPSSWKIGYIVSTGFSNLNQDLLNSVKTFSPTTNLSSTPTSNINRGTVTYSSSPIHAGFSFAAGIFITRDLSKRFSFSGGINYHYYSTRISTGSKIDNAFYAVNTVLITAGSYYENGNTQTFTNQYHFIEMPLLVNFKLNKNNRMPFSWQLGLSPGYLLGSNALYYNPNANIYTTTYLQPNKMQLNGETALMIGFPLHIGELQIGPQLQYGFTGFVNTNDGKPGHLFYAGLKISFIPGKK
jgi:hypothetical protein